MADERVEIQVSVSGGDTAENTLKKLERLIDELNNKKVDISVGGGTAQSGFGRNVSKAVRGMEAQILGDVESGIVKELNTFSSKIKGVGSVIQGLGSASNWTASFASGIGQAFSSMGSMFHMNAFDTARRYLTAWATHNIVGGMSNVIARADIMNTFVPYMALAGVDQSTAQNALNRINQSILGLPIGLDEAAQRLRRYQMFMGDTEAATNMTIGIQKAIIAGGASDQMKTQAYYQIDRLLSAGKLSTSRQWLALLQGLGVSVRFLAEEMGDAGMSASEMAAGLTSGQISTNQFLRAIQRLASNPNLDKALDIYKSTYASWASNIQFAVTRGGTNVLDALSETLNVATGRPITGYMEIVRNQIDTSYKGIAQWIRNNPAMLDRTVGSFGGLFQSLAGINYQRIGESALGNIGRVIDYTASALNRVSGGKLEDFVSFATTIAAPVGSVFKAVSGGLPELLGVYEGFKDFDFEGLMDKIGKAVGSMANIIGGVINAVPDGVMSTLLAYGLVFGRPVGNLLGGLGRGVYNLGTELQNGTFAEGMSGVLGVAGSPLGILGGASALGLLLQGAYTNSTVNDARSNARAVYGLDSIDEYASYVQSMNKEWTYGINARMAAFEADQSISGIENSLTENNKAYIETEKEANNLLEKQRELVRAIWESKQDELKIEEEMYSASSYGDGIYYNATLEAQQAHTEELQNSYRNLVSTLEELRGVQAEFDDEHATYIHQLFSQLQLQNAVETGNWTQGATQDVYATMEERRKQLANALQDASQEGSLADTFSGYQGYTTPKKHYVDINIEGSQRYNLNEQRKGLEQFNADLNVLNDFIENPPDGAPVEELGALFADLASHGISAAEEISGVAGIIKNEEWDNLFSYADEFKEKMDLLTDTSETQAKLQAYAEVLAEGGQPVADAIDQYITGPLKEAEEAKNNIDFLKDSMVGWFDWINEVGSEDNPVTKMLGSIKEAADELSSGDGVMGGLKTEIEETAKSAEDFGLSFDDFKEKISTNSEAAATAFGEAGEKIAGDAEKAQGAVDGLADSLNGIHDVNASINITGSVNLPQLPPGLTWEMLLNGGLSLDTGSSGGSSSSGSQKSTTGGWKPNSNLQMWSRGGVIYAANGMFIPHGTDTVPAMLTPGEYVVRRKAAAAFGKAFMDRVNALDIHGAFRALSHRMSVPSTGSFIANNQRTYDNHASVTQNIVTNSQSFTHRRARRWVRALT